MTFGSRLKELRGKVSRKDFAELVGSHENTLGNYERNARTPDISFVSNVCNTTGVSLDWLIRGKGPMRLDEAVEPPQPEQDGPCARCEKLEADNRELVRDNRELVNDNRELVKENRKLMRENGDLRVELERIKARAAPDGDKDEERLRVG